MKEPLGKYGLREGERYCLLPQEDQPKQFGRLLSEEVDNGTVIISLDEEYCNDEQDDGLREVPITFPNGKPTLIWAAENEG